MTWFRWGSTAVWIGAGLAVVLSAGHGAARGTEPVVWRLDNLERIGGHAVTAIGAPHVVHDGAGAAVAFDGARDGLLIDANPLEGLSRFTIEVEFQPAVDGPEEQRFVHVQEREGENRGLIELRMLPGGAWALDTYLRSGASSRTLLDRRRLHTAGEWHTAALTYDGRTMAHYVDGIRELEGDVAFVPMAPGRTSIGVRQNRVSWFKGLIRQVRITPAVVPEADLLRPPAATPMVLPLWPEGVPNRRSDATPEVVIDGRVSNVHDSSLTYIAPEGPSTGTAVIVCPGGGYARLAMSNEAAGLAQRLSAVGVSVFVLKYRLADYGHPAPLQDVLRAVRLVRARAAEFGVDPARIGVFGASAGGHLAAVAATLFEAPEGRTGHALDAVSARPDFVALQYPVITMEGPLAHAASRHNLLGAAPAPALAARLSPDRHVTPATPPVFLVHTAEDRSVPLDNSVAFYQALRRAGVDAELHLYQHGAHGFGTRQNLGSTSGWVSRLIEWMQAHRWLPATVGEAAPRWGRGFEGQRKADLGNGFFRNPILAGDYPDPSVLKDGDDYYMTFSSFDAYPGLVIWHSRDLVNWRPIGPALFKNVGSVWAPDLIKHGGRYYIYFPGIGPYRSNYVVWADDIAGPWSDPVDLKLGRIDPGHAVGEDGRRYLFLSAGYRVALTDDGLATAGAPEKVYEGWRYPEEWVVEGFAQEGPKLLKRGDYYYMVLAEGGTAGPPTGHMVVAARSRSIHGPWENSPYNPIIRTVSASERWWSKGHGTLVEGPRGDWWMVYHAYENGFATLGRQTLLEPMEWTDDGWFRATGADPSLPLAKPAMLPPSTHGLPYSDDFSTPRVGVQWSFYKGGESDAGRYRYEDGALVLDARGTSPADSSPLWFRTGDHAYEIEVTIERDPGATAGLLLFYSGRLYAGLGFSATNFYMHSYGLDRPRARPDGVDRRLTIRVRNDRHIVSLHYSVDGERWTRFDRVIDVSGYHHNTGYDFLSLRPALYAAGEGRVRFRDFRYRAIP